MTIRDYLTILRQRLLIAVITVALTTSTAIILSLRQAPEYTAFAKMKLEAVAVGSEAGDVLRTVYFLQGNIKTEAELLKSEMVARRVKDRLNLPHTPQDLVEKILVGDAPNNQVVAVVATADDPKLTAALANAFAEEYVKMRREQVLEEAERLTEEINGKMDATLTRLGEVDAQLRGAVPGSAKYELARRQRDQLVGRLAYNEGNRQALIDSAPVRSRGFGQIIQYALPPSERSNSDPIRAGVLGLIVGIPLALGLALLLDAMSDTIKTKEEAEKIVGTEMLGVIPLTPDWRSSSPYIVTREAPYSAAAEAYRTLRINLDSRGPRAEGRQILFTSPGMAEGKTLTSANVAIAFAEAGRSVLLVSADMRRPRLHHLFGVEPGPGLSDLLRGDVESQDVILEPSPNLYLLPSGSGEDRPDQLLNRVNLREALQDIVLARKPGARRRGRGNGGYHRNGTGNEGEPRAPGPRNGGRARKTVVGVQPDVILLDAPSVLGAAEVSAMASAVDGVVLVLHAGVTRRQAAARAAEQVRRAGGTVAGLVLVGVRLENDYSVYPPVSPDAAGAADSTWSRVLSGLRR